MNRNVLIGGGAVALVAIVCFLSYTSAFNYGNSAEQGIKAAITNNESIYANGAQKVSEVASVPVSYRDDLLAVVKTDLQSRYGSQGTTAAFIREHNIALDSSVYAKIQQVVQGFRDDFTNAQTGLVDRCRSYNTALGSFWNGMWLHAAGYPKIDVAASCQIVSTSKARDTFATHTDTGLGLRNTTPTNP